ncbi:hypothetical protein [Helicobacter bizzozeronii]|uniref:hypothetical protein n=1 Tax=Helicobacter bizzozeronii TaxID=56877 RepID=UPI000CF1B3D6|nr:hypothetical protein [Helicobacter bizzozeronii]
MKTKEVFLGIVLGLIPIVAFAACLFAGWQLVKACHSHLALFSQVFLGAPFLLLVFVIYKRTGWVFGCKMSGIFTLLVVLSGVFVGLGRWDRPCYAERCVCEGMCYESPCLTDPVKDKDSCIGKYCPECLGRATTGAPLHR